MLIEEAITSANTEHVLMFLLVAYVEALNRYQQTRTLLERDVARLPIRGEADIAGRLAALSEMLADGAAVRCEVRPVLEEARGVLAAALMRLRALAPGVPPRDQRHSARLPARVQRRPEWSAAGAAGSSLSHLDLTYQGEQHGNS